MAQDFIRYDLHVQDALRGVVRKVLADVAKDGLPGDHHFYITFLTRHPGVQLSNRMRAEYPDEMTVVLQHQFWDLTVTETVFEVGLSFKGIPEKLVVPFEALTGFFDRSVDFGLRFESEIDEMDDEEADADDEQATAPFQRHLYEVLPNASDNQERGEEEHPSDNAKLHESASKTESIIESNEAEDELSGESQSSGAQIVRLDAFRKKNT